MAFLEVSIDHITFSLTHLLNNDLFRGLGSDTAKIVNVMLDFNHASYGRIRAYIQGLFQTDFEAVINNIVLILNRFQRKKRNGTRDFIETCIDIVNSAKT